MIRLPVPEEKEARPAKKRVDTPPITKGNMQVRVVSFAIIVAVVFIVLAARLWYLQVLTGNDYSVIAKATQTRVIKDPAQRGVIYDRDGEVLANNVPGLNVTVIPDEISREKVKQLAEILGTDPEAVLDTYDAARRLKPPYTPTEFRRMVTDLGGKEAADRLLAARNPSSGFTELYLRGKENLKLSVEFLVLQSPWRTLFTPEQRAIARRRLLDVECELPPEDSE